LSSATGSDPRGDAPTADASKPTSSVSKPADSKEAAAPAKRSINLKSVVASVDKALSAPLTAGRAPSGSNANQSGKLLMSAMRSSRDGPSSNMPGRDGHNKDGSARTANRNGRDFSNRDGGDRSFSGEGDRKRKGDGDGDVTNKRHQTQNSYGV
jgi:hypothetical protein